MYTAVRKTEDYWVVCDPDGDVLNGLWQHKRYVAEDLAQMLTDVHARRRHEHPIHTEAATVADLYPGVHAIPEDAAREGGE